MKPMESVSQSGPAQISNRILVGWCYTHIRQYRNALKEISTIDYESPDVTDRQYYLILHLLCRSYYHMGQYQKVLMYEKQIRNRCRHGITEEVMNALFPVCCAQLRLGKYQDGIATCKQIISLAQMFNNEFTANRAHHNLAIFCVNLGDFRSAEKCVRTALADREAVEDSGHAVSLLTRGIIQYWVGKLYESIISTKEAMQLAGQHSEQDIISNSHLALGRTYIYLDDRKAARRHITRGLARARELGSPRIEAIGYEFLGDLERRDGNSDEAGNLYRRAMKIALRIAPEGDLVVAIGRRVAEWHMDRGELKESGKALEGAMDHAKRIRDRREEGILYRVRARLILASRGRYQSAGSALDKSVSILHEIGTRYEEFLSLFERGKLRMTAPRKSRKERRRGIEDFRTASDILEELGLKRKHGKFLIEAVRMSGGVVSPHEGLLFLSRAEILLKSFRDQDVFERVAELRAALEDEIARLALEEERPFVLGNDTGKSLDSMIADLRRWFNAGRAFLRLEETPGSPRTIGCPDEMASEMMERLLFQSNRNLIVSAGDLSGERSVCHGPFMAMRIGGERSCVLYLDRGLGEEPFTEREAGEFAACAERVIRKVPSLRCTDEDRSFPTVIADSRAMQNVIDQIVSVRNSKATVLIEGETGTGKGVIARLLHEMGDRARKGHFVQIHCAEFPEGLLESELFGHVRGAFTGAVSDKKGLFEMANGGTFFLDEIGDLSFAVQLRLLRVIEEGRLKRVGETVDRKIDVRIVAATHRDLVKEVDSGRFRKDLFYRLHVVRVRIPPLRERREDIPPLVRHFVSRYAGEEGKSVSGVDTEAMKGFTRYSWPGNVRELQNEIRRNIAFLPSGEKIRMRDLSPILSVNVSRRMSGAAAKDGLQNEIASLEETRIHEAILESGGELRESAGILGISPQLLRYKLKKYKIQIPKK